MNIRHLEYIIEIYKCGSINKAAQNMYLNQSNLSNVVKSMEKDFGYEIFRRKNSGIEITPEGELFCEYAENILMQVNRMRHVPNVIKSRQNLSIIYTSSSLFSKAIIDFQKQFPNTESSDMFFDTVVGNSVKHAMSGNYRISICSIFSSDLEEYEHLASKYNLTLIKAASKVPSEILMSKNSPLSTKKELCQDDIKNKKFVIYSEYERNKFFSSLDFVDKQNTLLMCDRSALTSFVAQSDHISIRMKEFMTQNEKETCVSLPMKDFGETYEIICLYSNINRLNSREKSFLKHFQTTVQNFLYDKL